MTHDFRRQPWLQLTEIKQIISGMTNNVASTSLNRPLSPTAYVVVNDVWGKISEITWRATRVCDTRIAEGHA